ncbi:transporter [Herbinix luporum]|uniref:transporter n=1 Tax=Herbinix luporum TaxID=1679721 RepID=UPI0023556FA9|nr:transporter [Herbinix luporum]MDI9489650.1 transporter [Bacillota bacterium]
MNLIKKYKSCLPKIFILFFFILMFSFPYASYKGASSGLMLWFLNVLPTLLPFIIISNMMIKLNIAGRISHMLYPILGRLFHISPNGSYPILIGFLSGLPMGAKSTADLVCSGKIDNKEGNFLLSMCNNASPIFIMSYIATNQLKIPGIRLHLFFLIYGSSIISAISYRAYHNYKLKKINACLSICEISDNKQIEDSSSKFSFDLLDNSIMNGFEVITKIGGYIILFSILAQIINEIGTGFRLHKAIIMGILEITTGIDQICKIPIDTNIKIVLVSLLTSFGGLSGLAQTKSVLGKSRLSIKSYILVKLLSAFVAMLLTVLYVFCFRT